MQPNTETGGSFARAALLFPIDHINFPLVSVQKYLRERDSSNKPLR